MASEYSVNIKLNTTQVKRDLKTIGDGINNLGKKQAKGSKAALSDAEKQLKLENTALSLKNRGLGLSLKALPLQLKGVKLDEAVLKIQQATVDAEKFEFDLAKNSLLLADKEIKKAQIKFKAQNDINKATAKTVKLQTQANKVIKPMGPFSRLPGLGSGAPLGLSGVEAFPERKPGAMQTVAFPPKLRGPTSPIGGLPSIPGSPAALKGRRGFDFQSALISGGFPLLFGQGPITAAAGALGGGIGGMFGQMGGFAGGIAATAAVQAISNAINGVREFGEGLKNVETSLATVTEKSLFSSEATQKRAEQLKKLGKQQELNKLLTQELTIALGGKGLERLKEVGKSSRELARTFGQLGASIQAILARAILPGINALNTILKGFTIPSRFRNFKESLSGDDLARFNEIVLEERGTVKRKGKTKTGMLTVASQERSLLRAIEEGLGGNLSLLDGTTDPNIEANLDKRIAFLQRSLEVGNEQAIIEQKIVELKDKGTDLTEKEIGNKLRLINNLEKVENMYKQIGSAIETGLVDAIEGAIQGTKTLGEVASSVFAQIQRSLIQFGVNSLLGSLGLPGFANGGRPPVGRPSIVGEKGPELFVPDRSGTIIPNNQLGGSTNVVVNVDASGSNVEGDEQQSRELGRVISAAIQSELLQQKRPGGLLA